MKCVQPTYTEPHKVYKNMINKVEFKCKFFEKGCREKITVDGYKIHCKECKFFKKEGED